MRATRRRRVRLALGGTALIALVAACGADGGGASGSAGGGGGGDDDAVLRVATIDPIDNWDPLTHANPAYTALVFDTLTSYAPDGYTIEPELATEWEQTNEYIELKLRDDVTFHDGTPFNAEAAVVNLERWRDTPSSYQSFMANVTDITAVDEYTVRLDLSAPAYELITNMAETPGSMIAPSVLEDGSFTENPVGTGPWVYNDQESVAGAEVVVDAYEDYWRADQIDPSRVEMVVIGEPEQRYNALRTGDVDVIYATGATVDRAEADGFEFVTYPKVQWSLMFADIDGVFSDIRVRQAICYAIDPKAWMDAQFNGYGDVYPQRYREETPGHDPDVEAYTQDLDRARQLMAEAGNPDINFTIPAASEYRSIYELFGSQLAEIGIDVEVKVMPFGEYFTVYQSGDYPAILFSDSSEIGPNTLYSQRYAADAPNNPYKAVYPEVDALSKASLSAPDQESASRSWDDFAATVHENAYDCAYLGLPGFWIWDPESVQNVVPTPYQIDNFRYDEIQMVN